MPGLTTTSGVGNIERDSGSNVAPEKNGCGLSSPAGNPSPSHQLLEWRRTYPSQSLRFLDELRSRESLSCDQDNVNGYEPSSSRVKLRVVVVGAGIGGLALAIALRRRGHPVRILEQAAKLGEVGAGIQIPPNSGRLLRRWGVLKDLEKWAVKPECINFLRWEDGSVIGHTALGSAFQDNFQVPYLVVHRAHLHQALVQRAVQLGVTIDLDCKVVQYNPLKGFVVLAGGTVVEGDLVVAADGIKSIARSFLHENLPSEAQYTGFAAYRATVDANKIRSDPDISWILQTPSLNIWIGEDRHVMSYTIAAGESLNLVLSHVDHSDPDTWAHDFNTEHVKDEFRGWDPRLTKILSLIDHCMKWPLREGHQLKTWVAPFSKLLIIGDAAHAMLPYMSQGAAMAVEDGAALAVVLDKISSEKDLPYALKIFEKERIKRSSDMQNASRVNGLIWHFPDGAEQRARDEGMNAETMGLPFSHSSNQWSDPVTQWWAYGYDAEKEMEKTWERDARVASEPEVGRCKI